MRKKFVTIVLLVLALGVIGTSLSTLYKQNGYVEDITANRVTFTVSYGFPLGWHGYSHTDDIGLNTHFWESLPPSEIHWFSLGSFILDTAFWFAISFLASSAAIKSVNMLRKTRVSEKPSVINI